MRERKLKNRERGGAIVRRKLPRDSSGAKIHDRASPHSLSTQIPSPSFFSSSSSLLLFLAPFSSVFSSFFRLVGPRVVLLRISLPDSLCCDPSTSGD